MSLTFPERFEEKNDYYHIAVMKLFHSIDDTKILNKLISSKMVENLSTLLQSKKGQSIFFSLFIPLHSELATFEKTQIQNTHSKKDSDVRLREVKVYFSGPLVSALVDDIPDALLIRDFSFSRFTSSVMRFLIEEENVDLARALLGRLTGLLLNVDGKEIYDPKQENEFWILTHPDAQRVAKSLVLSSNETSPGEVRDMLNEFNQKLTSTLLKRLDQTLRSKARFLLLALIENTGFKE